MYRHGFPPSEINKQWTPLRNQVQIFSIALQRLLTPVSTDEPHNFIADYRGYDFYSHQLLLEKRLLGRTLPFYRIPPHLLAPAFEAGEAKNLGALLFINLLTDTPFSEASLHLAQSSFTKTYYFTTRPSPSWMGFFQSHFVPFSFEDADIHQKLRAVITSFLMQTHPEWWVSSGLLKGNTSDITIHYEDVLLDEILTTMFRLYLTPMPVIDYLLDHSFKPSPQETVLVSTLKAHIRGKLSRFQNTFINQILPTITSSEMGTQFFKLHTDYLRDLYQFNVFPFSAIESYFDDKSLEAMKCDILNRSIETKWPSAAFSEHAFDQYLELTNKYFIEMLFDDRHFLWQTLNRLSENLSRQEISNYDIALDENLHCLLIKSIEFNHNPFAKFILSTLHSKGKILEISQLALGANISAIIYRPFWDKHGLVDVAEETENQAIRDYLYSAGATPLLDAVSRPLRISPSSFFEEPTVLLGQRPRSKRYTNLSDFLGPLLS